MEHREHNHEHDAAEATATVPTDTAGLPQAAPTQVVGLADGETFFEGVEELDLRTPMTTAAVSSVTSLRTTKSRIGLVVLGAIASGLLLGLLLVLVVFAGAAEHEIVGAALFALGAGFVLLTVASTRYTDQPQPWAFLPGVGSAVGGLALLLFSPGDHALALAGWVWPALLLVLSVGRSAAPAGRCTAGHAEPRSTRRSSCFC